jgi:hypothetical protein
MVRDLGERLEAVRRRDDVAALFLQQGFGSPTDGLAVVDDHDPQSGEAPLVLRCRPLTPPHVCGRQCASCAACSGSRRPIYAPPRTHPDQAICEGLPASSLALLREDVKFALQVFVARSFPRTCSILCLRPALSTTIQRSRPHFRWHNRRAHHANHPAIAASLPTQGIQPMSRRVAVLMDPIQKIKIHKDSTFAMMLEAQRRGHEVHVLRAVADSMLRDGHARFAHATHPGQADDPAALARAGRTAEVHDAAHFDFDADAQGPAVRRRVPLRHPDPRARRSGRGAQSWSTSPARLCATANEKLFTALFPQCCAPPLVVIARPRRRCARSSSIKAHWWPRCWTAMGGASIFRMDPDDPNLNVMLETVTREGTRAIDGAALHPRDQRGRQAHPADRRRACALRAGAHSRWPVNSAATWRAAAADGPAR